MLAHLLQNLKKTVTIPSTTFLSEKKWILGKTGKVQMPEDKEFLPWKKNVVKPSTKSELTTKKVLLNFTLTDCHDTDTSFFLKVVRAQNRGASI